MHEHKGVKYWLNFNKQWYYSLDVKKPLKTLNSTSFGESIKEVKAIINENIEKKKSN